MRKTTLATRETKEKRKEKRDLGSNNCNIRWSNHMSTRIAYGTIVIQKNACLNVFKKNARTLFLSQIHSTMQFIR